ncbi:MAG: nucleotide-binding protein [Acidimicrobiales bacterium]|nr:MAG: nucleotide-binding protein [Acidimicrobiales bacterium]
MPEFVVITGMSGGGRTGAADALEDLGWFVIDNLPPDLIPKVAELAEAGTEIVQRVALVVGPGRGGQDVLRSLEVLRSGGVPVTVLFLDATDEVLIRRYEGTRRRHPLGEGRTLAEAISIERELLAPVRAAADVVLDTSDLNVHELRERVVDLFGGSTQDKRMQVVIVSFGYTHGLPLDADLVFDCRFLRNPYWEEDLRYLTGLDQRVKDHVGGDPAWEGFVTKVVELLQLVLPAFAKEGRHHLTVAFGCTGGRHRSVAAAEEIAKRLRESGAEPRVFHRDIER